MTRAIFAAVVRHRAPRAWWETTKRIVSRWITQVVWLLEYEPTWFPEFGFGIGALGWGAGALLTDDIAVSGWACALPLAAGIGGLARCLVLLRLWYGPRVVLASLSALLWAWLWWGLAGRYGIIPMMGPLAGVFVIELLTAAKFSVPCARELCADFLAWRGRA